MSLVWCGISHRSH